MRSSAITRMLQGGKMVKFLMPIVLITSASSALAGQGDLVGRLVGTVGAAIADGKQRRQIAAISQPLAYNSDVPDLNASDPTDPRVLDIAGLRLGMTPADARRALQVAGFSVNAERGQDSFAAQALRESNLNIRQDPAQWDSVGRKGQGITVKFVALPGGAVVDSIEYGASSDTMTEEAFVAQLGSKYGEADLADGDIMVWCVGPDGSCAEDGSWRRQPHMIAQKLDRSLQLNFADPARDQALEARYEAIREANKPRLERADF